MPGKDDEAREVVAELEARIGELRESVAALTAILSPPAAGKDQCRDQARA